MSHADMPGRAQAGNCVRAWHQKNAEIGLLDSRTLGTGVHG